LLEGKGLNKAGTKLPRSDREKSLADSFGICYGYVEKRLVGVEEKAFEGRRESWRATTKTGEVDRQDKARAGPPK
jgi:hypothetical protein